MSVNWSALLESTKILTPKLMLPVCILSAFLLFSPAHLIAAIGLSQFVAGNRAWIGLSFLASASLLISHCARTYLPRGIKVLNLARKRRFRARALSEDEKQLIRGYINNNTRTLYYTLDDGVVSGLVREGFLERATSVSNRETAFAFNITDWAYEYFTDHRELIQKR